MSGRNRRCRAEKPTGAFRRMHPHSTGCTCRQPPQHPAEGAIKPLFRPTSFEITGCDLKGKLMSTKYRVNINQSCMLARYVVLNPVRAKMVPSADDWSWSSYRATVGKNKVQHWLNTEWILASFAKRKSAAVKRYATFVAEGVNQPSPWERITNQVFLGNEETVARWQSMIENDQDLSEVPSSQRRAKPRPIAEYAAESKDRNSAIVAAHQSGGYTLKELGDHFGLHYSTVSSIIKHYDHKSKT